MPRRKEPRIPDAILDQLLAGADAKTIFDPNGLLDGLKKALAERVLNADLVSQRRQAERHALPDVAFGLPVQRLMLPVLLEQDHRQEARAGPAAGDHMERCRG